MLWHLTLATFWLVYLRGIQQLNVVHGHYILASITPFAIAAGEVASVLWVVDAGWPAVPWVGAGGAFGVTAAMASHKWLRLRLARKNGTCQ